MYRLIRIVFPLLIVISGCRYNKGDMYFSKLPGDELRYVVAARGSGEKLVEKAGTMKLFHESKGNVCTVTYLTDSISLRNQKGILLFNSMLPEIKEDILSKGYFGTFTSKQQVKLLLVSYKDFDLYFKKAEKI